MPGRRRAAQNVPVNMDAFARKSYAVVRGAFDANVAARAGR
jgi:hypothetical protein